MEVFVARQAIFDRRLKVYGYELLFRACRECNSAGTADSAASLQVITNSFFSIGMERLLAGTRAFINFPQDLLADERIFSLPANNTVIEILETVRPEPAVVDACRVLREKGYVLALDDFSHLKGWDRLANLVSIIKVDFRATTEDQQQALVERYAGRGICMLAEKIETQEEFKRACNMGYHYFQGYFFARPVIVSRREIPGSKLGYLRILKEIHRPELELFALEALIQREVSLASKLLRYINSSIFGWINPVHSIRQALALLGEQEIRNWVSLSALPTLASDKPDELVRTALLRARFSELLAPWAGIAHRKADLFLIGLFSLLDAMLDRPLAEILDEMRLGGDIAEALLGTAPPDQPLAGVYHLVRQYEIGGWTALAQIASRFRVPTEIIVDLYLEAVSWSDEIFHAGTSTH
ncbi:MAG TPA: HDOD domain-containing protein [Bryobacteraceae bacterium]|nr:HDOD domain-containing protein [Bryobacteraceae bacterium]